MHLYDTSYIPQWYYTQMFIYFKDNPTIENEYVFVQINIWHDIDLIIFFMKHFKYD